MPKPKKDPPKVLAKEADKYALYQEREDFCATAFIACEWVKSDVSRTAVGVDLDEVQLAWGLENNVKDSPGTLDRVKLICKNVLDLDETGKDTFGKCDIICAYNFSVNYMFTRTELIQYLKICRSTLTTDGIFICDVFGGENSIKPDITKRDMPNGVKYEFQQIDFCPITHKSHFQMSFKFQDGSKIKDAFTYDWRVWTVPELREAMIDAGFSKTVVWFYDQSSDDHEAEYKPTESTHQRESFHAYIVGVL